MTMGDTREKVRDGQLTVLVCGPWTASSAVQRQSQLLLPSTPLYRPSSTCPVSYSSPLTPSLLSSLAFRLSLHSTSVTPLLSLPPALPHLTFCCVPNELLGVDAG